ncbi:MAG: MopE-related protein [Candidatus Woesearchaeota archaeon]
MVKLRIKPVSKDINIKPSTENIKPNSGNSNKSKAIFLTATAIVLVLLIALFIMTSVEMPTEKTETTADKAKGVGTGVVITDKTTTETKGVIEDKGIVVTKPAEEEDDEGLVGMAIYKTKDLTNDDLSNLGVGFTPSSGTTLIQANIVYNNNNQFALDNTPEEFSLIVRAKVKNTDATYGSFQITFKYNPNHFEYISSTLIKYKGTIIKEEVDMDNYKYITLDATYLGVGDGFSMEAVSDLLTLKFKPIVSAWDNKIDSSTIEITKFSVLSSGNTYNVNNFIDGVYKIRKEFYIDNDGDGVGVKMATDDNTVYFKKTDIDDDDDQERPLAKNDNDNSKHLYARISASPDCDDNRADKYPGNTEIYCDGIDNNCVNGMADEVVPDDEKCKTDSNIYGIYECGIHVACQEYNPILMDCNNDNNIRPVNEWVFTNPPKSSDQKCAEINADKPICNSKGICVVDSGALLLECDTENGILDNQIDELDTELSTLKEDVFIKYSDFIISKNELYNVLTPGCGNDECDSFENCATCPEDCIDELCSITDGDGDDDGDGVKNKADYCPETITNIGEGLSIEKGHVNVNGCYFGDTGTLRGDGTSKLGPDGCVDPKQDGSYILQYYLKQQNSGKSPDSCTNVYGEELTQG